MPRSIEDRLILAYVAGILDEDAAREVERKATEDAEVREQIDLCRSACALHASVVRGTALDGVSSSLREAAEKLVRRARRRNAVVRTVIGATVVASFIAGVLSSPSIFNSEHSSGDVHALMHDIVEYHPIYAREDEHLVEVPASRREHIASWLGDRVGLKLRVPPTLDAGFEFAGGRMIVVEGKPLAQLFYIGVDGARIALCVVRVRHGERQAPPSTDADGHSYVGIIEGPYLFVAAGPTAHKNFLSRLAPKLPELLREILRAARNPTETSRVA
jgi:anti-sigma factor RsiW